MKKIIAGVVVLIIVTVAGLYFAGIIHLGGAKTNTAVAEKAKEEVPPVYLSLDPAFVVNFTHRGTLRYLQVSLEVMYHDPALLAKVTAHMPAIRNDLILLFSNQDYEKLSTASGKEELRHEIFRAINHVIGFDAPPVAEKPLGLDTATPSGPSAPPAQDAVPAATETAANATKTDKDKKAAVDPDTLGEIYITNFVMQ